MVHNDNGNNRQEFVIGHYLHLLEETGKKHEYVCPKCQGTSLHIKADGIKYFCHNCRDSNGIAYELRKLNGEFNGKGTTFTTSNNSNKTAKSQEVKEDKTSLKDAVSILAFYEDKLRDKLAYNIRTKEVELNGKTFNLDDIRAWTARHYNVSISNKDLAIETIMFLARTKEYDPVHIMLEDCFSQYMEWMSINDGFDFTPEYICKWLFGQSKPLYQQYIYRWLIGAVARVYEPGCKFDECLVLYGRQRCYKSTFFNILGHPHFGDDIKNVDTKDSLLTMAKNWINEMSEIDSITAKTYHGILKSFLSRHEDIYRVPYGKDSKRYPRNSVIVGSTNRDAFLTDATGNRRFWIIPIPNSHTIPIKELTEFRTVLLGYAVGEYKRGVKWQLPQEYHTLQDEDNETYSHEDPWESVLEVWLDTQKEVTNSEILNHLKSQGYPVQFSKQEEMRLGDILNQQGWTKKRIMRDGKRVYRYFAPDKET